MNIQNIFVVGQKNYSKQFGSENKKAWSENQMHTHMHSTYMYIVMYIVISESSNIIDRIFAGENVMHGEKDVKRMTNI